MVMMGLVSVQAGTVVYNFVGTGTDFAGLGTQAIAFRLTVPTFVSPPLNGNIAFTCAQLGSSTNCGSQVFFLYSLNGGPPFANYIQFNAANGAGYVFYFPEGSFGSPGVYTATLFGPASNIGSLTVTSVSATQPSSVPAPSSVILGATGTTGAAFYQLWRRRRREYKKIAS